MNVLYWFKRDLRAHDNPGLTHAAALGPVLPVYVAEPGLWAQSDASARHWAFVAECLAELRADLAGLGAPLVVRSGDAVAVIARLVRAHAIGAVVSQQETGTLWTFARDRAVRDWARGAGIAWNELAEGGVRRGQSNRDGWAEARDRARAGAVLPPPALQAVAGVEPGAIPGPRALGLAEDRCPHRQNGGRSRGLELLDSFITRRAFGYRRNLSSPLTAERGGSRLSAHLAWGSLSAREVEQAAAPRPGFGPDLRSFQARLAWRDHFRQKLEDAPDLELRALHDGVEARRDHDPARLAAFCRGETGLPFVDACLRSLAATGWLNFRMRAMLTSVGCYHLGLDWRAVGAHLARQFTDYDPGIHWPQVQMQAGVTGINKPRIYNPVKQGLDQDPAGVFTRRWLPELASVPDAWLQTPWRWQGAGSLLGRRYPEPLVDPAAAARAARADLTAARREPGFAALAEGIARRHASPADDAPRFVNDRAPRRPRPAPPGQLALEF
jgi:deoxyribodipyrimidine photo-lyase